VHARAVPVDVLAQRFAVPVHVHAVFFAQAHHDVAGDPHLVAALLEPLPKIWNSHWPLATSALMPSWLMPASRQRSRCSRRSDERCRRPSRSRRRCKYRPCGKESRLREARALSVLRKGISCLEAEPRTGSRGWSRGHCSGAGVLPSASGLRTSQRTVLALRCCRDRRRRA
jgi:hypothetical protein